MTAKFKNIFFVIIFILPFIGFSQITFDKSENELIRVCNFGNLDTYVKEISTDSLLVVLNVSDYTATGSDNLFLAIGTETHKVEFKATYKELETLNSWIKERHSSQTGGSVKLGEWEMSYTKRALGSISLFLLSGPTGNFEIAINSNQIRKCFTRKYIDVEFEKYLEKKERKETYEAKREALTKARAERDSTKKAERKSKGNI
jgi:hypothetical protein